MPSILDRMASQYAAAQGKPADQPASAASPSALAGVAAPPPMSQTERVVAMYKGSRPAERQPAPALAASAAVRDAMWPLMTATQKMSRMLGGDSSATIPQGAVVMAYRKLAEAAGVDHVTATKALDALLAFDPSTVPAGAKSEDVIRARALATGIDPGDAQRCVAAFLALGDEPGKMTP